MVVRARNVCPSSTSQCSEDANSSHELRQRAIWLIGQTIPHEDQSEPWSRADGNEHLKDGSFRVSISNGCADRREPFHGVSEMLVLYNLVVVQPHAHNEGSEEGGIGGEGVQVRDVVTRDLDANA
jgi:hypothetical protein